MVSDGRMDEQTDEIHGGWGQWSPFGSCSSTCGNGLMRRDRQCDNPWPSSDGNFCFGDNINYDSCIGSDCPVGWLPWSAWSKCSGSCGDGIKTRQRTCQNVVTSLLLGNCTGQDQELVQCSQWNCSVLFRARGVADYTLSTKNQIIIFTEMLYNVGGGYNPATGKFTAPVTGIYLFTVHLCAAHSESIFYAIMAKGEQVANGHTYRVSGWVCVSGDAIVQLDVNHVVYVKTTYTQDELLQAGLNDDFDAKSNSFQGVLLK
ncbi:A disintegrin and metalloproteinase with thrombospondin motifs adt-1-like [Mya arenaria]|uniref:A disintegrin and metalloproteinase with thrombospondin motifs adt-1-like n=1 Tax=Mya arenaria TaxID=6604 RepID=UPI0022E12E92|nr:A disintegrin and metalloproteinase with thrombospondin motifs adt-1-like [Mya arenaria]